MKAVLKSIKPFYVFLIFAKSFGWPIPQHKEIELFKTCPTGCWNGTVFVYCSKDHRSFNCIPQPYRDLMRPFFGKVIGYFCANDCDEFKVFENGSVQYYNALSLNKSCLSYDEIADYIGRDKKGYAISIDEVHHFDVPKDLSSFKKYNRKCYYSDLGLAIPYCESCTICNLARVPQSWCYVEDI